MRQSALRQTEAIQDDLLGHYPPEDAASVHIEGLTAEPDGDARFQVACEDNLTFMAAYPDGYFRLIVTSPPYNIGKSYENRSSIDRYLALQEQVNAGVLKTRPMNLPIYDPALPNGGQK